MHDGWLFAFWSKVKLEFLSPMFYSRIEYVLGMVILLLTIVLFLMGKIFPKYDIRWFVVFDSSLTFVDKCYMASMWASQVAPVVKNTPAHAEDIRDAGSIPGSGRSPGGGYGNPLQYPCLENPTEEPDRLKSIGSHRVKQDWSNGTHVWPQCGCCLHSTSTGCTSFSCRRPESK